MKTAKKIKGLLLATVMCISTLSTPVLAAETETTSETMEYDFEIAPDMIRDDGIAVLSTSSVDNTFNVTGSHTGSTRSYSGSKLRYSIRITDTNGNAANNILAVRFCQNGRTLREDQYWANGSTSVVQGIPISSGQSYYFQYLLAYGTTRTLKVHMVISSYN